MRKHVLLAFTGLFAQLFDSRSQALEKLGFIPHDFCFYTARPKKTTSYLGRGIFSTGVAEWTNESRNDRSRN
jgi:hypothetical protein